MRTQRTRRFSLFALAAALAYPSAAWAHATLVGTSPRDGAVLATAPAAVRLQFDDAVQPAGGTVVVRNDTGGSVLAAKPRLEGGGKVLVLPLARPLRDGDYSVRWRALSDDGHFVTGVLAFAVGAGRAPPSSVLAEGGGNPSALDVASRMFLFAGLLVAAGTALSSVAVFSPALRGSGVAMHERLRAAAVEQRAFVLLVAGGCVLFAAGVAGVVRHTDWSTRFGAAYGTGLVVAFVAGLCAALSAFSRELRLVAILAALALVAVPSVAGHALDAGRPWPNVVVDMAHVGAAAAWTGALVALLAVVPGAARALGAGGSAFARRAVARASDVALVSVAVLAGTGVARAWFEVGAVRHLWDTGYGRALLVKTVLLGALVAVGWVNRTRLLPVERLAGMRRTVPVELVLVAGIVVAVAFLTQLRPGVDAPQAAPRGVAAAPPFSLAPPPPPPRGALVLAREAGTYAVAIAVQPARQTATILASSGGGADGLHVLINGRSARSCGHGCYAAAGVPLRQTRVGFGGRDVVFTLPRGAVPAEALLRRATRSFDRLRSVVYRERLASSPTRALETLWRVEAPNRLEYRIRGGAQAIVVGARRWDRARAGGRWHPSAISPLDLPAAPWGEQVTNAYLLARHSDVDIVAWANPSIPAWFTARLDRRTALPRSLTMTAAAHFMRHRYLEFNRPLGIRPPR
jgi:copper transport protein